MIRAHGNVMQRLRKPEIRDQFCYHGGPGLCWTLQGLTDPTLLVGIDWVIEPQDMRQLNAGGLAMWDVTNRTQGMSDVVAGRRLTPALTPAKDDQVPN